jgi:dihydropteroate synthase
MHSTINCRGKMLDLAAPHVMGILNATPDSFYRPDSTDMDSLLKRAEKMLQDGASILDIGGMSSRPGAQQISVEEEYGRLIPVLERIRKTFPEALLSVDTYRSVIGKAALEAGAHIINDISGGVLDPTLPGIAASFQAPYICMHMKGMPDVMQQNPHYDDILAEMLDYYYQRFKALHEAGLKDIILDPGFGFGKNLEHNYHLLRNMDTFHILEKPILVGISRKSMICKALEVNASQALNGSTALHMLALMKGAAILRVHDVREAMECIILHRHYAGE